jgi:hypothetical protein
MVPPSADTTLGGVVNPVPAWVATDFLGRRAVFDADYENGRFYWNGQTYASEAALNTAMGTSKTGAARTITPYVFGPELITNGAFDADVSGWTAQPSHGLIDWDPLGYLKLDGNSQVAPNAYQQVTSLATGKGYAFQAQTKVNSGGGSCGTRASVNSTGSVLMQTSALSSSGTFVNAAAYFSAEGSTGYMLLYNNASAGTGSYRFDNASLKEAVPFQGLVQGAIGMKVWATAPASVASTVVVAQAGGSDRGRVRNEVQSDMHLHYKVTWNNVSQADIDLGALTPSTPFVLETQAGVDTFSAALNGGTRQYAAVGTMPGVPQMWIGRSYTGETWTGTIERVAVFKEAHAEAPLLVGLGDSLMYNTRGGYWNYAFAAAQVPPHRFVNFGVAGAGCDNILSRLNSDVINGPGWFDPRTKFIFDGGYNDGLVCTTKKPPLVAAIKNAMDARAVMLGIPESPWMMWDIPNGSAANNAAGQTIYVRFTQQNADDLALYGDAMTPGGHILRGRENKVAAYNPALPQDIIDHGNDITPDSLREDTIHPNTAGSVVDYNLVYAASVLQGWPAATS